MTRTIYFALMCLNLLLSTVFFSPWSLAQEKLPPFGEILYVDLPEDYVHAYTAGSSPVNFIHEYIPKGQSLKRWDKLLSVLAVGRSKKYSSGRQYAEKHLKQLDQGCKILDQQVFNDKSDDDFWVKVHCRSKKGRPLPGADKDIRHEVIIYRYLKTKEVLYQFHVAWHGADKLISKKKNHADFMEEAQALINRVKICDITTGKPCTGFDNVVETILHGTIPEEKAPSCFSEDPRSCKPSIVMSLNPLGPVDPSTKGGIIQLNWAKTDLADVKEFANAFKTIAPLLKRNQPVIITIRGPAQDHRVTLEERITTLTFAHYMYWLTISSKHANPRSSNFSPHNMW